MKTIASANVSFEMRVDDFMLLASYLKIKIKILKLLDISIEKGHHSKSLSFFH